MSEFALNEKCQADGRGNWYLCEILALPGCAPDYPECYRIMLLEGPKHIVRICEMMHGCLAFPHELRKFPGDTLSLPAWLTNMLKTPQDNPDKVKQREKVK